jgi:hypothetical protein
MPTLTMLRTSGRSTVQPPKYSDANVVPRTRSTFTSRHDWCSLAVGLPSDYLPAAALKHKSIRLLRSYRNGRRHTRQGRVPRADR